MRCLFLLKEWREREMPKVSLIIPVYNVEKYLAKCLDSIMAQDFNDYEVICINDCSPDSSDQILEEYKKRYPDKLHILTNEENLGQGRSRIHGLNKASGQYVMFIDSDDYVKTDYVRTFVEAIEKEKCEMVIGGYIKDIEGKHYEHLAPKNAWSIVTYSVMCSKIFEKNFLLDNHIHFTHVRQGEDIFFNLNVYYHVKNYKVIDYCGYYYYLNRQSTTKSMNYEKNFEETVACMFNLFMEQCDVGLVSKEKRDAIEYAYLANMINALITYGHGGKIKRMKKKYEFYIDDLKKRFPAYKSNPNIGMLKPKGQTLKIRLGVGVVMFLNKIHLDRALFYAISLV